MDNLFIYLFCKKYNGQFRPHVYIAHLHMTHCSLNLIKKNSISEDYNSISERVK